MSEPEKRLAAVMFADVRGYSGLSEPQLRRFFSGVLPRVAGVLDEWAPFYRNSWGDGIVAAFADSRSGANCALSLRDLFASLDWAAIELPALSLRCAVHAGHLYLGDDPISGTGGVVGSQVIMAARVEPVTLPGQVWVTDVFVSLLSQEGAEHLAWDDLGERPLAKEWGATRLYRLRRATESAELPRLVEPMANSGEQLSPLQIALRMVELGTDEQRIGALDALGYMDHPLSLRSLVLAARNSTFSFAARKMAVASLDQLSNPSVTPDAIDLIRDPETPVDLKLRAIELLGKLRDPRALEVLPELAEDEDGGRLTEQAILALGMLRDSRAVATIAKAIASSSPAIARVGIASYGLAIAHGAATNDAASVALTEILMDKTKPEELRGSAIEALILEGPVPIYEETMRSLSSDKSQPRHLRMHSMAYIGALGSDLAKRTLLEISADFEDPLASEALRLFYKGGDLVKGAAKLLKRQDPD